jgi:hypothetical protein
MMFIKFWNFFQTHIILKIFIFSQIFKKIPLHNKIIFTELEWIDKNLKLNENFVFDLVSGMRKKKKKIKKNRILSC